MGKEKIYLNMNEGKRGRILFLGDYLPEQESLQLSGDVKSCIFAAITVSKIGGLFPSNSPNGK